MNNYLTPVKQLKHLDTDLQRTEIYVIIANDNHKKVVLSRVLCHANEIKTRRLKQAQETSE